MKKQLRTLALLLTATLPTLNASAYDLEIDGIFYNILSLDDMTCEVTSDDVNFSKYEGDIVIPGTVIYNGRTLTVVRIGTEAFWQDHITSVTIPNTVTDVYVEAFKKCEDLKRVVIEDGNTPLQFYSSKYNEYPFGDITCTMFHDSPLESVYLGRTVFYDTAGIDQYLNLNPFWGHETLKEVTIGNSVKELSECTFRLCRNLENVTFGNSIEKIGELAFVACSKLISVNIPNSVKSIGASAFSSCSGLTELTLGNSVDTIGNSAFSGCYSLRSVSIPNSVKSIGVGAFSGCGKLENVTIGNSVVTIGDNAFEGCSALTSISIPNSVEELGEEVFMNCSALASVNIGHSVPQIGESSFEGCTALKDIVIGHSTSKLGRDAFSGCTAIATIYVHNPVPPTGANFENLAYMNAAVHVPQGSLSTYQAADGWENFWSISEFTPSGISNVTTDSTESLMVTVDDGNIVVENANGRVDIYDLSGTLVKSVYSVGRTEIVVPQHSMYIVKSSDKTVKIAL